MSGSSQSASLTQLRSDDRIRRSLSHQLGSTFVTLPELPYEQPVYEGTVYPGTLTAWETVPTIGLMGPVFRRMIELKLGCGEE